MTSQYLPLLALLVLAVVFAVVSFFASSLLAPRRSSAAKSAPYESGLIPGREPPERFPVRFYLIAMIFIVFDIEIIFLYPWAVIHRELGLFGLIAIAIFAASVFESFLYLISKGALDWGPIKYRRAASTEQDAMRSPERSAASTVVRSGVRQVGLEGRMVGPGVPAGGDGPSDAPGGDAITAGAH